MDYHVYSYVSEEVISIGTVENIFRIENSMKLNDDEIFRVKILSIVPSMDNWQCSMNFTPHENKDPQ